MKPYQQRVIDEKDALAEKCTKLSAFVFSAAYVALDDLERSRLTSQLRHMMGYLEDLRDRIAAFE